VNAAVVAPIPNASVDVMTAASTGVRRQVRAAMRIVCQRLMAWLRSSVMPESDAIDAMS
jgi:hypothetical protein